MCRSCLPSRSDEQGTKKKEEEEERAFQIGSFVAYPIPPLLFPEKFSPAPFARTTYILIP